MGSPARPDERSPATAPGALLRKVRAADDLHRLFPPGEKVVVAVSGGPDSLALLDALQALAAERGFSLHVAHLDHGLRGEAGAADARFVAERAAALGLPATIGARDVPALRAERRLSVEDAARQARYEFLAEVVAATGAHCVAVGHTADDQVETVVLHWLRGSGLPGLRGMRPVGALRVRRGGTTVALRLCRPLLDVSRAEVEAYCRARGLAPRLDASNAAGVYLRNRVRRELLPSLEAYNPRFREAALRTARLAAEDEAYLRGETLRIWAEAAREDEGGVVVALDAWRRAAPALQTRLLREAFARVAGEVAGLELAHVETARRALLAKPAGTAVTWPRGARLTIGYGEFRVGSGAGAAPALPAEPLALAVPGVTGLGEAGGSIAARLTAARCADTRGDARHADLDLARCRPGLFVRRRRPGDRMVPLGPGRPKKVQDVLVDARVPRAERDRVPVVTTGEGPGEEIVWLAGVRLDDRYKVTAATREVLCLRLVPRQGGGVGVSPTIHSSPGWGGEGNERPREGQG